ncbi:hypothetical protein JZ751_010918 [Albula glossodonta]|uniref:Thioredoxin-dependent peroxide reductase, mitochondrial n=1 Tax=Albula glossodonta TaxID=121402 RepID=A0A8T2NVQ0_9TELE|nr:hypothetical protein JZ751_010918 [Albula glossodonta]
MAATLGRLLRTSISGVSAAGLKLTPRTAVATSGPARILSCPPIHKVCFSTTSTVALQHCSTFVCPTEIISFSDKASEFHDVNCEVVGVSVDSHFTHLAWINTPRKSGGLGHINIPLLADLNKQVSKDYGVLLEGPGIALRGLFIIDPSGVVRHMSVNDLPVGRCVEETLRLVKAFQFVETHGEVCPASWTPDSPTIKPTPEGSKEYFEKVN